jgi:hypothetical protein
MNTGMQFTNAQPASRICSTYHLVACSEPTGRYETTTSVRVSLRICAMSTVEPSAFVIFSFSYLPRPSWVIPRWTGMPSLGSLPSPSFSVLFWPAKIASERSLPTLSASMSKAAVNSMSRT